MKKNKPKSQPKSKALIPKLRFPEFRNKSKWEEKCLGDFEFHTTANNSRADLSNTGDIFYIHYGDIHTKFNTYINFSKDTVPKISSSLCKRASFLKNGDLVIADASEDTEGIAKAVEVSGLEHGVKAVAGLHTILLRDYQNIYINGFKGLLREIETVAKQIQRLAVGVKVYSVSKTALKQVIIPRPSPPEQQKIADCLSSLDELITAESKKLEFLKAHKKGLMQQLFPAEGESVPKFRFPEFRNKSKWVGKRLGDMADINPKREKVEDEKLVSFLPMRSLSEDGRLVEYKIRNFLEVKKGFTFFRDHDIIFAKITPCFENGKAALLNGLKNAIGLGSTEFHVIRAQKGCLPEFLFAQLYTDKLRRLGKAAMTGSAGQQRVPSVFFENYPVAFTQPAEQQKIADCLSSLDELIVAQAQKIDKLKTHKKGLMQQLFPSANEVK